MKNEKELIAKARNNDQAAIEQLLRNYQGRLLGYLVRILGDRHLAEDILQESYLKIIKALKTYKEQGAFKSWLFQIVHREALQELRRRKTKMKVIANNSVTQEDLPQKVTTEGHDRQIIRQDRIDELKTAIDSLPEAEKEIVNLRVYSGMTFKEISELIKIPINTALGRMHNAMKRLKHFINVQEAANEMQR